MALLVTIPASNYCEKARWALTLAKISFREEQHAPMFHMMSTIPKRGRSVPLIKTPDATFKSSDEIMAWCAKTLPSLHSPSNAIEKELYFDNEFGPHARRYSYFMVFSLNLAKPILFNPIAHTWEHTFATSLFPVTKALVIKGMKIDQEGSDRSWIIIQKFFDQVSELLSDAPIGTRFICGDTFSSADISFCSHASIIILPPQSRFISPYIDIEKLPTIYYERIQQLRATRAGQFVMYCFANLYPQSPFNTAKL
ncbi:glutathione S-transferase [Thraustotheca clavata]|uniref:Glutathione S-transferase n=1 Tax=Thraustotheca clavata TaxID=74557 RepID=A0A1V9ZQL5_9STRA|nr:glutathione S-transferase [Thraustotheca clavata]